MATTTVTRRQNGTPALPVSPAPIPRMLRKQAEEYLALPFAYMESPVFKQRNIEQELFTFDDHEPELPLTSWYQPTREDAMEGGLTALSLIFAACLLKLLGSPID